MRLAIALVALLLGSGTASAEAAKGWDHFRIDGFDLLYNGLVMEHGGNLEALALARTSCTPRSDDNPNADCFYMNDRLRFFLFAETDGSPSQINLTIDLDRIDDRETTMVSLVIAALDPSLTPEDAGRFMGTLVLRSLEDGSLEVTRGPTRYEVRIDRPSQTLRIGLRSAAIPKREPSSDLWPTTD